MSIVKRLGSVPHRSYGTLHSGFFPRFMKRPGIVGWRIFATGASPDRTGGAIVFPSILLQFVTSQPTQGRKRIAGSVAETKRKPEGKLRKSLVFPLKRLISNRTKMFWILGSVLAYFRLASSAGQRIPNTFNPSFRGVCWK